MRDIVGFTQYLSEGSWMTEVKRQSHALRYSTQFTNCHGSNPPRELSAPSIDSISTLSYSHVHSRDVRAA